MTNYDVFISCKSEDYSLAEEVYSFLNRHHIHTFLASKELRKLGDSEYREAIEDALESAEHLIILASKPEYIKSKWVKYEWGLFLNAKIDGYKKGNIITILNGIEPKDISFALRKYESFPYSKFKDSIITYVETEASVNRAKKAKEEEERELAKQRANEERQKKLEEAKARLIYLAEDYKKGLSNLDVIKAKIIAMKKLIGTTQYICPVCHSENSIDDNLCVTCGWMFSPIEGIEDAEYLIADRQKAAHLYQRIFNASSQLSIHASKTEDLTSQIKILEEDNIKYKEKLDYSKLENENLTHNITKLNDLLSGKDSQILQLQASVNELRQEKARQEQLLRDNENKINNLKIAIVEIQQDRDEKISYLKREVSELQNKLLSIEKSAHAKASRLGHVVSPATASNRYKGTYSIWITFATKDVEDIVKQYNSSFTGFAKNGDGTIKNRTNFLVTAFNTRKEAEDLKNKLEYKGATVIIKLNGEDLETENNHSSATKSLQSQTTPKKIIPNKPNVFNTSTSTFGIVVKHCGINKAKVIQVLSREYGKTTDSFKNQLEHLPLKTQPNLSRKRAEDILIRLGQLGATVELYQL